MVEYDVADTDERTMSRIVKTAVAPRPIAWVSTTSTDGVDNLAPFSSYNYLSSTVPTVWFNVSRRDGRLKDSARNAIDTGEFAVNVVTAETLERMDHTAEGVPPDVSEFDLAGLERAPCTTIDCPRVAEAPVVMECTYHDRYDIHGRTVVIGEVAHFHVDESVMTDGKVDAHKLHPMGRLGGPYYTEGKPIDYERQY